MPTGIDYLHLVEQQHTAELAERVQYAQLRDDDRARARRARSRPTPATRHRTHRQRHQHEPIDTPTTVHPDARTDDEPDDAGDRTEVSA